jgi:hypothetical protein
VTGGDLSIDLAGRGLVRAAGVEVHPLADRARLVADRISFAWSHAGFTAGGAFERANADLIGAQQNSRKSASCFRNSGSSGPPRHPRWQFGGALERHLNLIERGPDAYGVPAAARYWFGVSPERLTARQAAFLAALIPARRFIVAAARASAASLAPRLVHPDSTRSGS